ncbi:MAG: hypothetical protein FWC46_06695 [Actinomycetia bacterium]|nr:hypothetical protein [Actinomycetes bacterium]
MWAYSEDELRVRLSALPAPARARFAEACARHLVPHFSALEASRGGSHDGATILVRALGACREAIGGRDVDVGCWVPAVEPLIPDEDGGRVWQSGPAQHAAIAVVYAVEACRTGGVQAAVLAARHVYEAADCLGRREASDRHVDLDDETLPDEYRSLVAWIDDTLREIETGERPVATAGR